MKVVSLKIQTVVGLGFLGFGWRWVMGFFRRGRVSVARVWVLVVRVRVTRGMVTGERWVGV